MQRLKENRAALLRIMRDDRLNPNSRLIATLMSMYLDADDPRKMPEPRDEEKCKRDKDLMHDLIRAQFIDRRGIRPANSNMVDDANGVQNGKTSPLDKEYQDRFKAIYEEIAPSQALEGEV